MEFMELIIRAKREENSAQEQLLELYKPLISKEAIVDGIFDEDLYQELCCRFIRCIDKFEI